MKSIKTGIVVVVMLVVVYGVWQMINKKPIGPPHGVNDLMAGNFGGLDFEPPGGMPEIAPPNVQVPGFGAPQSTPMPGASGGGVMPDLRPAPQALTPALPSDASPFPGTADHHGHPLVRDNHQHHGFGSNTRSGAPVVSPQGAPVVGPQDSDVASGKSYGAVSNEPPSAHTSVYGQADTHSTSSDSGWGDHDSAARALGNTGFEMAWDKVQQQLARGELAQALAELSIWYGSSDIPADKQTEMVELLDQLAGAVVYSPQHLIEAPYSVRPGETLQDIATAYQVPWQLLANINGIADPKNLQPGSELKVLHGPFNALISLERQELTLIVDGRYAGRFPITLGNDPAPRTGEFTVREKQIERTFVARDGRTIPPGDEANPYGPYWIGLDGSLGIHGAAAPPRNGARSSNGSIAVSADDAQDLFAILSEDSRVLIRR